MSKCRLLAKKAKPSPSLELDDYSFDWNAKLSFQDENKIQESSSDDELEIPNRKLTKKEKIEQEKLKEIELRKREDELLSLENPQSADQYDRLLLGSPSNSELWVKYMSLHLQATEFEKARAVARRALQTIDIKEEQERLNVWIALLNFENLYGTKESLNDTLAEAVRVNDDYQIYSKMMNIYVNSNKSQELDKLITKVSKKFKNSLDSWLHCCNCYFQVKEPGKARFLFQRALSSLEKKIHITFISRFALLENKFGFKQESHTLFEHILTSYPARTDIWSCYVDMLIKSKSIEFARQVLERARVQKLPPKKMKVIYTKSISFEEKFGDESSVQIIKNEAKQYVSKYAKILDK